MGTPTIETAVNKEGDVAIAWNIDKIHPAEPHSVAVIEDRGPPQFIWF